MEQKSISTWGYGLIGVAAVGALTLALLAIVMISSPPDRLEMTSITPPAQEQSR